MNQNCSLPGCSKIVKCRCSVCKTWYCSLTCQEDHWPRHSKDCVRVPELEWPPAPVTRQRTDSDSGVASAACAAHAPEDRGHQNDPGIREACRGEMPKPLQIQPDPSQFRPNDSDKINEIQNVKKRVFKLNSVESVQSIDDFYIRLEHENAACLKLMKSLNQRSHHEDKSLKVKVKDLLAVQVENVWYRGVCLEQTSDDEFKVYLMDFSRTVSASRKMIRHLNRKFSKVPSFCHRVCLAGIEPSGTNYDRNEILFFSHLVTIDPELQFSVEFIGGVKGGRSLVKLRDDDGNNDITELLLESGIGVRTSPAAENEEIKYLSKEDDGIKVTVSHMITPSQLFLLPEINAKILQSVEMQISQSIGVNTRSVPESFPEGSLCLLFLDKESQWCRARVIKHKKDGRLSLFLIDQGGTKIEYVHKAKLRSMSEDLQKIPGLAVEVTLRGIKPGTGTNWIIEECEYCDALLDVGRKTPFLVRNIKNHEEMTFLDLEDPEGNDVASMMVELGCAAADKLSGFEFKHNVLMAGSQKVLVLAVVSPKELFLCSPEQFEEFSSRVIPASSKAATEADLIITARPGDLVLANRDGIWCRAKIIQLVGKDVLVKLLDLAITSTFRKELLRVISPEVCGYPILAVKCCLQPTIGEKGQELSDDKLSKFIEYEEVKLTVTGDVHEGKLIVKI